MTTQAPPPAPTPPEPSGWISLHSLASAWHIPVAKLRRLLIRAGVPFRKKTFVLDNIARVPAGSAITRTYVPAHLHPQARTKAPRIIMNIDPLPHPENLPHQANRDTLARSVVALLPGEEWHCIKLTENSITMECSTLTVTISTTAEP